MKKYAYRNGSKLLKLCRLSGLYKQNAQLELRERLFYTVFHFYIYHTGSLIIVSKQKIESM